MKILLIILIALTLNAEYFKDITVSEVTSVYDGDTFRVNIKGYPAIVGYRMRIRVNGIDTPEMRGKCQKEKDLARKAKQYTVQALRGAKVIKLKNIKRGNYFRLVADVYVDGKNLADGLIKNKLGLFCDGGKKNKDWCE